MHLSNYCNSSLLNTGDILNDMNKWNLHIDFGEWLYTGIIERQGLIIFVPEIENQISNNCNINYAFEAQEY